MSIVESTPSPQPTPVKGGGKGFFIIYGYILSIAGLVGSTNIVYTPKIFAGEKIAAHQHENIKLPTKRLMVEIEKRAYNILEGILVGDFKYVKQEAGAVLEEANKINENFFPRNPDIDAWYKRSKDLDPSNIEAIKKLKDEFGVYMRGIATQVQEIQKAADTNDAETTFNAYSGLLTKTCFECHRRLRDTK